MLDNIAEISILYDFYGALMPPKQREIFRLYYEDNLSLGEIAQEYDLTRQAIHTTIKRGENKLRDYDSKLKLSSKYEQEEKHIKLMIKEIDKLIRERDKDLELVSSLCKLREKLIELNL